MRRDVYIENDSGGFSVLAADAVDDIIEDARANDARFVTNAKALLLELYGDDSMPVRIVADEPLRPEEEAQWLARASWQIDSSDGRILVMGGFDPDVLSWWKEAGGEDDGRGVAAFTLAPGRWKVDVYAHVGSMNGRAVLSEADEKPGTAFRRSHPGRAFPLWLAKMLEFSGEDDPGHAELWSDVRAGIAAGKLAVDTEGGDAIGFLVHVTRASAPPGDPPEEIWFGRADNARVPASFPLGLRSEVPDPELRSFHDKLLGIEKAEPPRPIADSIDSIIETWPGAPLKRIDGGTVAITPSEIFLLHWMAGLTAESTPRFELWVEPKGTWAPPQSTADFAVITKSRALIAIGPATNTSGWHVWWIARDVAKALGDIPDGSTLTLAMASRHDDVSEGRRAEAGRALYGGDMSGGTWEIADASPQLTRDTLSQALEFTRDVALHDRVRVRSGAERSAFDKVAEEYSGLMGPVKWEGDVVRLVEQDQRMLLMLATPVFRARFGQVWPMDVAEE